jgi:DNA-binding NarL/FixJ family response regulator
VQPLALFKVVLVDSDPKVLEYLNGLINWQENGFIVVGSFTRTEQALDFCKHNPPELIIMDYLLTGTDGTLLAKSFLELHRRPYVIQLTDTPDFYCAQKAIQVGVSSLLVKSELTANSLMMELNKLSALITAEKHKSAIVKRQLLRDLVQKREPSFDEICSKLELLPDSHQFAILLLKVDTPLPMFPQKIDVSYFHVNWHGTLLPDSFEYVATILYEPNTWVMLLRITEHLSQHNFCKDLYSAAYAAQCN